uniref:KASH domain-containing protein n=1 Tax=Glossina pallidipes TaxID=7398 RepID=A0A1A9ZGA1_GLOPL
MQRNKPANGFYRKIKAISEILLEYYYYSKFVRRIARILVQNATIYLILVSSAALYFSFELISVGIQMDPSRNTGEPSKKRNTHKSQTSDISLVNQQAQALIREADARNRQLIEQDNAQLNRLWQDLIKSLEQRLDKLQTIADKWDSFENRLLAWEKALSRLSDKFRSADPVVRSRRHLEETKHMNRERTVSFIVFVETERRKIQDISLLLWCDIVIYGVTASSASMMRSSDNGGGVEQLGASANPRSIESPRILSRIHDMTELTLFFINSIFPLHSANCSKLVKYEISVSRQRLTSNSSYWLESQNLTASLENQTSTSSLESPTTTTCWLESPAFTA